MTVQDPSEPLPVGVVGVGRMGRHHARVLSEMPGVTLLGVVDADPERRADAAEQRGCRAMAAVEELLDAGAKAAVIAVPTVHHLAAARPLLEAGVGCLIEKPLAPDGATAREIKSIAESTGATLQVGHTERYNPAVRALEAERARAAAEGRPGIFPRFIEVHRVSPMTFRSVDVGVVFDMMIHDLDVVLNLVGGAEPDEIQAAGVSVLTEHEDVASARLTFDTPAGPCIANITASRLAFKTERKIRIIAEDAYVSIDYAKKAGVVIRKTANEFSSPRSATPSAPGMTSPTSTTPSSSPLTTSRSTTPSPSASRPRTSSAPSAPASSPPSTPPQASPPSAPPNASPEPPATPPPSDHKPAAFRRAPRPAASPRVGPKPRPIR